MGCWGITAFESDAGLDAVDFIRNNLPEDGKLQVQRVLEELQQDDWNRPDNPKDGPSHTSPMALDQPDGTGRNHAEGYGQHAGRAGLR